MSATVTVCGGGDDMVVVGGDIVEEFNYRNSNDPDVPDDLLGFSDGTVLRIRYATEGYWRITPAVRGTATLTITQATDEDEDYSDHAVLVGDVAWVVHGVAYATRPQKRQPAAAGALPGKPYSPERVDAIYRELAGQVAALTATVDRLVRDAPPVAGD